MGPAIVLYDEDCGFCRWSADRLRSWDRRGALRFMPLQDPDASRLLHVVPPDRRASSWHLVEADGRVWSAGTALPRVMRALPGGAPLAMLAEAAPGVTDRAYAALARRRTTLGRLLGQRACAVDPSGGEASRAPTRVTGA
ncbi:MAG: thiol-disulfide oxidoreductase DCC family protein [Actinomycetota bacterium]